MVALQWVEDTRPMRVIICSDSSTSALASLCNSHPDGRPDISLEMQQALYRIQMMSIRVMVVWVQAHVGMAGHGMADKVAKSELNQCFSNLVLRDQRPAYFRGVHQHT